MISLPFAKNKTYYVVGLGKSGQASVKALQKSGAEVLVWDDNAKALAGFDSKMIREPDKAPWSKIKAVIMAPGIPPSHEIAVTAAEKDVPVLSDIDLYAQSDPKAKIIGVTGTNGKSTTTTLIHHILNGDGKAQLGGNIGTPVLTLKARADYTVLELSSYQLERAPNLACDVAVLLNISPDHVDWHGGEENYIASKLKLFAKARPGGTAIIATDDKPSKEIFEQVGEDGQWTVIDPLGEGREMPFNQSDFPRLKGRHNLQNMLAAYYACTVIGIEHDTIIERMKSFEGLAHRQFLVRVINGIPYINDSKATNAEAAKMALRSFRNILWIAGGKPKEGGLSSLEGELGEIKHAFLIGEAQDEFARWLSVRGIAVETCDTLDVAVKEAHKKAQSLRGEPAGAPTVLFSPAGASFDQYPDFEMRGDHFVTLINALEEDDG